MANKERALRLLAEKRSGSNITYPDIMQETGYSKRQLIIELQIDSTIFGLLSAH